MRMTFKGDLGMSLSREILIWGAAVLVAAVRAVMGTDYVFNHFIFPPDTQDALVTQEMNNPAKIATPRLPARHR
jgi:hypothetical protein